MERFIDDFSKQLARAVSRRDALSISARTVFAAFISSTGIGRLWGQTASTSTCPACGTCQMCNTKAGKCGLDCENPCTAAVLCSQAQQFQPYLTLQSFLGGQFTGGTSEPQALVYHIPGVGQSMALSKTYTAADPTQTATLVLSVADAGGMNAYAIQINNGVPQYVYFVSSSGQIQQILPPFPVAGPAIETSASSVGSSGNSTCETYCNLLCSEGTQSKETCLEIVVESCILLNLENAEVGVEACITLGAALCFFGVEKTCEAICNLFVGDPGGTCAFPPGQPCGSTRCGTCENCANGTCTATTCPPGYSCDSTIGTCVCNNLCGTTCCPSGSICQNGICTTSGCPSGQISCGTSCCSAATQTCLNGACVTSTCGNCATLAGPGTSFCGCPSGGIEGPECCPPGTYCADSTTFACCTDGYAFCGANCCPPGTSCCGTAICCPSIDVCIEEAPGIFACVNPPPSS